MMTSTSNRKVSFKPSVRVRFIHSIYDYTASEIDSVWYNKDEMKSFTRRAIRALSRTETTNGSRGSCKEYRSRNGSVGKEKYRVAAREVATEEQDRQWNENEASSSEPNQPRKPLHYERKTTWEPAAISRNPWFYGFWTPKRRWEKKYGFFHGPIHMYLSAPPPANGVAGHILQFEQQNTR